MDPVDDFMIQKYIAESQPAPLKVQPRSTVWCTTQFEAVHYWPGAPEGSILKLPHRHVFHVKLEVVVSHADRDVEFIELKRVLNGHCGHWTSKFGASANSCEMYAFSIWRHFEELGFSVVEVTVSEDGENGATLRA